MQDCSRYDEMLSAFVDGELNEEETRELQEHLESCTDCRNYLELLRTVHEDLKQELPAPPEKLREGILYKIGLEQKRKGVLFGAFGKWTALAAVCCLAVLGAVKLSGGAHKTADSAAFMETSMTAAAAPAAGAAAADSGAYAGNANGIAVFSSEESENDRAEVPEEAEKYYDYAAETEKNEPTPEPDGFYDAAALPGYSTGTAALDSTSYACVGIVYAMPEGYPSKNWDELDAPTGERRWVVSREKMDRLAKDGFFDELYFGDLTADNGLIVELIKGED